jgi:hypothetical protein
MATQITPAPPMKVHHVRRHYLSICTAGQEAFGLTGYLPRKSEGYCMFGKGGKTK